MLDSKNASALGSSPAAATSGPIRSRAIRPTANRLWVLEVARRLVGNDNWPGRRVGTLRSPSSSRLPERVCARTGEPDHHECGTPTRRLYLHEHELPSRYFGDCQDGLQPAMLVACFRCHDEEVSGGTNIEPGAGYQYLESEGSPIDFRARPASSPAYPAARYELPARAVSTKASIARRIASGRSGHAATTRARSASGLTAPHCAAPGP